MKRRKLLIILILAILLFLPIPSGYYKDGGTRSYSALTYKIVIWNRLVFDNPDYPDGIYHKFRIYPFPLNFRSLDQLWSREERYLGS